MNYYQNIIIGPVIKIENKGSFFYLAFVQVAYKLPSASKYAVLHPSTYEYQTWGVATLKSDFGHILIKPETLEDVLRNLLSHEDVKFDDKKFDRRFYISATDALKAKLKIDFSFRNYIANISTKDFLIEIKNNELLIGNKRLIEVDSAIEFAEFLNKVTNSF